MTNPSIWTPGQAVSAESSNRVQTFIAAAGQTNFHITNFTYEVGTNSLEVDVSGVNQRPGIDFIETGSNSFSLISPIEEAGTSVFVRGLVDVHGDPQVISDASNVSYLTETVKTALDVVRAAYAYKNVRVVAGVLRNYGILGFPDWRFIVDSNHATLNLGSIALNGRKLQINYSGLYSKCLSLVACPDETLAAQGFTVGASVGTGNALIECGQRMQGAVNLTSGLITLNLNQLWPSADFSAAVGADGVVTITHPSNAGYQPLIINKEPGSPYRQTTLAMKQISATQTAIYPYCELAGYCRYAGASWSVFTSTVAGCSVTESGGTVTVTHPAISALTPPNITTRDNSAVIALPDSYAATTFTVKFRDFAGNAVATPNANMRFYFHRPNLLPAGAAVPGEAYFDLGYGTIDMARLVPLGGNIWVIGVFEA